MKTYRRVLKYIGRHKLYVALALLSSLFGVALQIYVPLVIGYAIDYIVGEGTVDFYMLGKYALIMLAAAVGSALFNRLMLVATNKLSYLVAADLRKEAFDKLNAVEVSFIDSHSHGDILSRIVNDAEQLCDGLLQTFSQLFSGVLTIVGTLALMLSIDYKISLAVILLTPLSLVVAYFITRKSHVYAVAQTKSRGVISGFAEEVISGQKTVKAFGREKASIEKFELLNADYYRSFYKAQLYAAYINPSTRFVNGLIFAAVCVIGAFMVLNDGLRIGLLSSLLSYAQQYTKPFNEISGVLAELQSARVAAERLFALIDVPDEKETGAVAKFHAEGDVKFEGVTFAYNPQTKLLENLDLDVKQGQKVAIVGPTGSGKTTLINLLMRFYEVNGGSISIDGTKITDMTRHALRANFGMVLQDSWLFTGSVKENIAYGCPDATDEQIVQAAKAARIHEYIEKLSDGYDTLIDMSSMSEGEKQLLCIARVMLMSPPVLILDEATSSIDTLTEVNVQKAFKQIMLGRTTFIVAHRLSTIRESDMILVMKNGDIIEKGTHEQLLQAKGFYFELYSSQFENEAALEKR
jgi:ATP-binding cassette subfamily B protein